MKLRPFQVEDTQRILKRGMHVILASAMGTGKTAVAISALDRLPNAFPAIVVCTVSLARSWIREFATWAPSVTCHIVTGENTKLPQLGSRSVLLVPWNLLYAQRFRLTRCGVRVLVADECHLAKNPDSLRGKALAYIRDRVDVVFQMTGTPVVNVKADLNVLVRYAKKKPLIVRRFLEDAAPDVPPKKRAYLNVQLRKTYRAEYDQAVEDFEEWYKEHHSELVEEGRSETQIHQALATEALARVGHLRRLVGQFKVPAAVDWISQAVRLGEPVVVFLEHQSVLKRLVKGLRQQRIRFVILEGSTSDEARDLNVRRFRNYEVPVFIGTRAAKEGLTLIEARNLLFVERYWTSADEEQAEDRIRRIGQTHETHIWFLHAPGTIDDRIDEIVKEKRELVHAAIGSVLVGESSSTNVARVLTSWTKNADTSDRVVQGLGLSKPQEPLPSPSVTHALMFSPPRWRPGATAIWCRMHGYEARPDPADPLRSLVHPAIAFKQGSFRQVRVCQDITAIVGDRLPRDRERRLRHS